MVEATLHFNDDRGRETFEVEKVIPASEVWNFWGFFYPKDKDGKTRARFIRNELLLEVSLLGDDEEDDGKSNLRVLRRDDPK